LQGIKRILDTHFRLLRHDIFGELKSTLGGMLNTRALDPDHVQNPNLTLGNVNAYAYRGAFVRHLAFNKNRGLEAQISFPQPRQLRKKSVSEQRRWWDDTKHLQEGSLLCLIVPEGQISKLLILVVSQKATDPKEQYSLVSGSHVVTISANLASGRNHRQLESLIEFSLLQGGQNVFVEFPGVLPATFVPILESLQQMQKASRLPFEMWILPDSSDGPTTNTPEVRVPPPLYARRTGFNFNLKPILNSFTDSLSLDPSSDNNDLRRKLKQLTSLDRGQCEALIAALSREFVLIQGPPGTGKSFLGVQIMRILIASKVRGISGPIVVV
jgi:hypothetical protein